MKKIVLTGGGTSGHVTPNIALLPALRKAGYEIHYIGSKDGMEKGLIEEQGIPYHGISSGKLRRYFDLKNFTDPIRVAAGCLEARKVLKAIRPDVVFSKGGFVAVPVVFAAKSLGIPCILHESDMSSGLANRLCLPAAKYICCNFPETLKVLPKDKAVLSGSPIREELFTGDAKRAKQMIGFTDDKATLLVMGGSLGSVFINNLLRDSLDLILKNFNVIHICGKNNLDPRYNNTKGYRQYEYVGEELKDFFALASLVVSRAGANAICELLALRKVNILIPLSAKASRGDQILNARSYEQQGFSEVLEEEGLSKEKFLETLYMVYENRERYSKAMEKASQKDAVRIIMRLIKEF